MQLSEITTAEVQSERNSEKIVEYRLAIATSAQKLVGPLFPVFWLIDIFYVPEKKIKFLILRIFVMTYCFSLAFLAKKIKDNIHSLEFAALALVFLPSLIITYMVAESGGISSSYYAGLNLIAAGAICFFPWSNLLKIVVLFCIYLPYLCLPFLIRFEYLDFVGFVVNSFFIMGTIVVSIVIRHAYEKIKSEEIRNKLELKREILGRNQIIELKSQEAVKLGTLTKQFSPQVVHAIKSGKLSTMQSLSRTKICALFIDIVNSTDRIIRLDKDDVSNVMSLFMEDTMKVLLKYDITIDKFLGDGVLAFANAPLERADYVQRVVDAAIEIRERIVLNRDKYLEHWLSELQIRIGISTGFANVGFYGSEDYFKSYTAIGKVINLASRLCATAEPSQILISQDVEKAIADSNYNVKPVGIKKLKGFENDMITTFEIIGHLNTDLNNHAIPICPNGHGILHFDTNDKGIYVLTCRNCNFVLESPARLKKVS